jgi:hypothetical protein
MAIFTRVPLPSRAVFALQAVETATRSVESESSGGALADVGTEAPPPGPFRFENVAQPAAGVAEAQARELRREPAAREQVRESR